jgi:uncharacterized membrane protein
MNYSILASRTFWMIVLMFITGGINAVTQFIPAGLQVVVMGLLSVAATYFHVNPSQTYNPPQA